MSRTNSSNSTSQRAATGRLRAVIGASAALLALGLPSMAAAKTTLPGPQVFRLHGLDRQLLAARGDVRVLISLRESPVLEASSSPAARTALQQRLSPAQQASLRRGPAFAGTIVKQVEQRRQAALAALAPAVRQADSQQRHIVSAVLASGGRVQAQSALANTVTATVPAMALRSLAARADVLAISPAPQDRPLDLATASSVVGAPSFWAAGFTGGQGTNDLATDSNGTGPDLSIESDKIQEDHPAFAGIDFERPQTAGIGTACGSGAGSCDHGTAVASLAIARGASGCALCVASDANQKGVAPGLDKVLDNDTDNTLVYDSAAWEFGLDSTSWDNSCNCYVTTPGASDPAEASSGSYGHANNGTDYDSEAQAADLFASQFGDFQSYAAGNDGTAGSVNSPCIGYDVLCAGAVDYNGTSDTSDDTIASFSSQGPTPAGRKKPDLVAVGDPVYARRLWQETGNLWAGSLTGTSFANPQVAAAGTLLEASGVTDPLADRAVLLDSAKQGRAPGCTPSRCAMGTQTGWQADWGWGELDLTAALAQRLNYATGSVPGVSARFYSATVQATGDRATLTWNRRVAGCVLPGCGTGTASALTNLDLKQLDPATCAVQTASESTIDNVEQIRAGAGQPGQQVLYDVRASSAVDGLSAEPFALAATRALTPLVSPTPDVALSSSSNAVEPGQDVTITATVGNASGDLSGDSANVTLNLPAGVKLISGDATQQLGSLSTSGQAGDSATASWVVRATSDGNYTLSASSDAQHCSEHFGAEGATALTATTPPTPPSGGGGDGTAQPGPPPQPVPAPAPAPTPIAKLAPHLHVGAPRWRSGRLRVAGSLARGARGHVVVAYTAKRHGKAVRVRVRARLRRGRFTTRLKVPSALRHVRAIVTVVYAGDSRYRTQRATRHVG